MAKKQQKAPLKVSLSEDQKTNLETLRIYLQRNVDKWLLELKNKTGYSKVTISRTMNGHLPIVDIGILEAAKNLYLQHKNSVEKSIQTADDLLRIDAMRID